MEHVLYLLYSNVIRDQITQDTCFQVKIPNGSLCKCYWKSYYPGRLVKGSDVALYTYLDCKLDNKFILCR